MPGPPSSRSEQAAEALLEQLRGVDVVGHVVAGDEQVDEPLLRIEVTTRCVARLGAAGWTLFSTSVNVEIASGRASIPGITRGLLFGDDPVRADRRAEDERVANNEFAVRTQGVRPSQPLTRDHVIATAMRLVDRDGSAGLTMRGLAAELGVSKTAVTWHVGDRSRLLAQIGANWLNMITLPGGGDDWIGWLGDLARTYRSVAHRHPHLARLTIDGFSGVAAAGSLAIPDAIVSRLAHSGLPTRELAHAYNAVLSATLGFVALELAGGPTAPIGADLDAVDAERAPAIERHLDQLGDRCFGLAPTADRFDDSFDYLIGLITDGLRRRTSRRAAAAVRRLNNFSPLA